MKKFLSIAACLALALSVCACTNRNKNNSISLDIDDLIGSASVSATVDDSAESGEPTSATEVSLDTVEATTDEKEIPVKFAERFASLDSYVAVTSGQTVSNVFGLEVVQTIECQLIKDGDRAYFNTRSESSMVKTSLVSYFYNGNVNYKYKSDDFVTADLATYLTKFGVYPVGKSIEGFKATAETIISVEKVQTESNYCYKVRFDTETSADSVKVQAKEFGGLDDYPTFSLIELTLTMDNYFNPISVDLSTAYKAKLFLETDCVQHYVVTYSDVNGRVSIPDSENFDAIR